MYEMSPSGSQPGTQPTSLGRGCLETQLAHRRDQVRLLNRFREVGCEELLALRHLHSAVRADSDYWCRRVLIVGTFYIPSGALAINCSGRSVRVHGQVNGLTYEWAYADP